MTAPVTPEMIAEAVKFVRAWADQLHRSTHYDKAKALTVLLNALSARAAPGLPKIGEGALYSDAMDAAAGAFANAGYRQRHEPSTNAESMVREKLRCAINAYLDEIPAPRTNGALPGAVENQEPVAPATAAAPPISSTLPAPHAQLSDAEIEAALKEFQELYNSHEWDHLTNEEVRAEAFRAILRSLRPAAPVGKWSEDAELVEKLARQLFGPKNPHWDKRWAALHESGSRLDDDSGEFVHGKDAYRGDAIRAMDFLQQRLGHSGERG